MTYTTQTEDAVRAAMIHEALALLSVIDAAQRDEDLDEDQTSRELRLILRARASRLAAKIIADLRAPAPGSVQKCCLSAVA